MENDPDILALVAASAALTLSGAPLQGSDRCGARRASSTTNMYSTRRSTKWSKPSLTSWSPAPPTAVLMVESEAKELNEDIMLGAVMFGHRHFQPVIKAIIEIAEKAAKEPREVAVVDESVLEKEMLGLIEKDLRAAYAIPVKQDRYAAVGKAKEKGDGALLPGRAGAEIRQAAHRRRVQGTGSQDRSLEHSRHRQSASTAAISKTVRNIIAEVGVLPRAPWLGAVHPRRDPRRWWWTTLGTGEDEQYIDALSGDLQRDVPAALQLPSLLGR